MNENSDDWIKSFFTEEVYIIPDDQAADSSTSTNVKPGDTADSSESDNLTKDPAIETDTVKPIEFKGENGRNITMLIPADLEDPHMDLLMNILNSAGLSLKDIALVNWPANPRFDLLQELGTHVVISFGLEKDPWCATELYEIKYANGISHLRSDSFSALNSHVELKRKLWYAIKELFGV